MSASTGDPRRRPPVKARPPSARARSGSSRARKDVRFRVGNADRRIQIMVLVLAILASTLGAKALIVQGLDSQAYAKQAVAQMSVSRTIVANRGQITDRFGEVLADSEPAVTVVADPSQVKTNGKLEKAMTADDKVKAAAGPATIADVLVKHIGGDRASYIAALSKPDTKYVILAKQVEAYTFLQISNELSGLGYVGVYKETAPVRRYPSGNLAASVVGFVIAADDNVSQVGAGGIEYAYNKQLAGQNGSEVFQLSPNGKIPNGSDVLIHASDGANVQLTLDAGLQYYVERRLSETVQSAGAVSGTAIVLNVKTGEVLAMANYPTFDSNAPGKAKAADLGNRAITDAYEPGSVQKVLTMAALTDAGVITPDTKVVVPGSIMSGGRPIKDAFEHGSINLTARGIVANSSNVGTVMLTRQMDKAALATYLHSFGLGKSTGIGLPGEAVGSVPDVDMADNTRDQISFGQGLSVTALQEATAVAAVVNGGVYNSPTIVRSAQTGAGEALPIPTTATRRVISPQASEQVLDMMESVVVSKVGANRFPIPGYRTADKSGTAERIDPACGCYRGYVASFIGAAPVEDPEILTYVVINQPQGQIQGSEVAAPAFKDIMRIALPRYGISPSSSAAVVKPIEW